MSKKRKYTLIGLVVAAIVGFIAYHQVQAASHKPEFCIMCHNMQPEYDSFVKGDMLAKKHNDANVTCHDCHVPTLAEQLNEVRMYATGDFKMPADQRGFKNEQCIGCHKVDEIRKKTAHYGLSNPHESVHNRANEMLECQSCHAVHHPQKLNTCATCHQIDWRVDSSWRMFINKK
ncbi:cytochrome c3 family protein [Campylobacter gastrosuis]|uniref:NapC/NirT family cytochrome c n=1 Tax=Campylobacter gastrosuis TaxID=2974576 RepID=A0ABT7HU21_9BACT|nr:cytochrome c3 family protein [Campylobacter gastrosuis]MDL0089884.1 NapC/NirT family cytochrome c [Campylobacter gastrosuis]